MAEQQTAADGGETRPEDDAGESGIDAYLREFDQPQAPNRQDSGVSKVMEEIAPVVQFAKQRLEKEHQESVDTAVGGAIKHFREADELKTLPDPLIRGFMYDLAIREPGFSEAFNNRDANPQAWAQALEIARTQAVELMADVPDRKITDDIAAANESVRNVSTDAPRESKVTNKDLMKMSDQAFRAYKESLED